MVLAGGVHMDSMRGGNPLIQVAADLVAGIPQPQNPPAVDQLSVTWLNGGSPATSTPATNLVPGSTITVETPQGPAVGTVIGLEDTSPPFWLYQQLGSLVRALPSAISEAA